MDILTLYMCRNLADVVLAYTSVPDLMNWDLITYAKQRAPGRMASVNPRNLTWHDSDRLMAYIVRLNRVKGFDVRDYKYLSTEVRRFLLLFNRDPRIGGPFVQQEVETYRLDLLRTLTGESLSFADGQLGDLVFKASVRLLDTPLIEDLLRHPNFNSPERYLDLAATCKRKWVYEPLLNQWTGDQPELVVATLTKVVRNQWGDLAQRILDIPNLDPVNLPFNFKCNLIQTAVECYPDIIPNLIARGLYQVIVYTLVMCMYHNVDVSVFQLLVPLCGYRRATYDQIIYDLKQYCRPAYTAYMLSIQHRYVQP